MPDYTIETAYHLPCYRHRTYRASTVAGACRQAIEDKDWSGSKLDPECVGETFVSGIWRGAGAAYASTSIPVPSHFEESIQRRARQFEILLGLLKMLLADVRTARPSSDEWIERAASAVARGEAIMADARDPDEHSQDGDARIAGGLTEDGSPSGDRP